MSKVKVLLDTDPGSDIDDAVCIGYLLSNPECDLLGITTVTAHPELRAELASVVCHAYGRDDIPIFPGAAKPLLIDTHQKDVPHARVLPNWPHRSDFHKHQAVPFLRSVIREHPGEVELVAIGALTNIALLFALDPQIPSLLRGLTIMGGRFMAGAPVHTPIEHNIRCDPHAAAMVFGATDVAHVNVIGLDVTLQVTQTKDAIRESFCTPQFEPIWDMAKEWFVGASSLCYHDIVAAATIFRPDLFSFASGRISVETGGSVMAFTHLEPSSQGPHQVAATVDREGFLDHFCAITGCKRTA